MGGPQSGVSPVRGVGGTQRRGGGSVDVAAPRPLGACGTAHQAGVGGGVWPCTFGGSHHLGNLKIINQSI